MVESSTTRRIKLFVLRDFCNILAFFSLWKKKLMVVLNVSVEITDMKRASSVLILVPMKDFSYFMISFELTKSLN